MDNKRTNVLEVLRILGIHSNEYQAAFRQNFIHSVIFQKIRARVCAAKHNDDRACALLQWLTKVLFLHVPVRKEYGRVPWSVWKKLIYDVLHSRPVAIYFKVSADVWVGFGELTIAKIVHGENSRLEDREAVKRLIDRLTADSTGNLHASRMSSTSATYDPENADHGMIKSRYSSWSRSQGSKSLGSKSQGSKSQGSKSEGLKFISRTLLICNMRRILKDMFCRREFGSAYEEHPYQLFYCIRTRSPICKFHHPKLRCPFLIWLTLNITDSSKSVLLEEVDSNGYIRDVMYGGVEWSTWLCFLSIIAHSRSVSIYLFNERNKTWFGSGPIQGFQNLYYTIIDHTEACKRLEEVCGALSRPILFNELLKGRLSAVSNTIGGKSLKHSCDDTYLSTDLFIPPCSLKIYNRNLRTKWRSQLNSHNGNQGDNLRRVLFQVVNCLLTKKADRSAMKAIIRSIPGVRPGQAILICENKYYGFFVNYILRVINYNLKGLRSIVQGSRKDMALKNILHPMANGYPNPLLENNNSPLLNDPLLNDPLLNDPLLNDPLLNDPQRNTESPSHLTIFPVASASITIPDKHLQKRPLVNRSRKHLEKPLEKRRMVREQVGYVSYPTWKKILDNRHKSIRIKSRLFPLMLETIGKRRLRMVHKINKGTIRVTISSGLMRDPQIVNLPGAVEIMSHAIPTLVSGGSHQYLNLRNCRESLSTRLFYSMLLRCLQATAMHHQYSTLVCSRKKHQTSLEELVSSLPEVSLSYSYFMITIDLESCFDFVNGFVFNASHRKYPLIPDISE